LLLDYWPLERFSLKGEKAGSKYSLSHLLLEKVPLFAMAIASCIVTFAAQKKGGAMSAVENCNLSVRLANTFISYMQYIIKMIWPARLAMFYPHPGRNISVLHAVISASVLLAVTILVLRFAKDHRYLVTGWFWYLGTLVPVIGLVQAGGQAMADRYSYITLTGLFIIIAWGLPELLEMWPYRTHPKSRKAALWTSSLAVLFVLGVCTYHQQQYWQNTTTLCEHALKVTEDNYKAHFCMADMLLKQGRIEEAIRHNNEALRIKPTCIEAINNLGAALYRAGKIDEAIGYYKRALELNFSVAEARINLAVALAAKGELADAVEHYRIALKTANTKDALLIHSSLGSILLKLGRFQEAVTEYREVLSASPNDPDVLNKLGYALAHTGKLDEAVREYQKTLQIKPDDPNTLNGLGVALGRQGKLDQAVKCFTEALRIKPDFADVHTNLGHALALQDHPDEAAVHLVEALRLDPNRAEAHYYLGQVLAQSGRIDEAIAHFNQAIRIDPNYTAAKDNLNRALSEKQKLRNKTTENPKE
jgi:tetratricopeptide (TPR) repeat protein